MGCLPILLKILSSYNVCSKEWIIRQYDHEVQGRTVIKPLVGVAGDEHVVGTGVDHGAEHLPVCGAEVLGLVDDDVLVAVGGVVRG